MKKLLDKIVAFLRKLFGKAEAPSTPVILPVAPVAPIAPAVPAPRVPSPVAPAVVGWPAGTVEFQPGVFYVPVDGYHQGPFATLAEFDAWKAAVAVRNENLKNPASYQADGRGTFPVGNLTDNDKAYLWFKAHDYTIKVKQNGDIFRDVLAGSHDDINRAINEGDRINPSMGPWGADTPELVALVEAAYAA